ncbi:Hsp20/alpha crystallin family protein [Mesorhizobium sp. M2C.T.Ca.TU.002.02.1.1]|jgi:HSP20 family protein|uniref:Heat shock protein Hsp20 n=1 Tax=Mesorhizobium plurifarium TaxID=69974 RepID=A0A0K2VTS7_MESPL|nr:Hsp20/alpha crystallin family protein [Mesorhizobium sp. M2C.T.Ca.TU.002.02.1.1]RUU54991.1 Hsp20/alpha crystallin family protein [Mesorhizobium sp. M2C.T.Ca.TU.002.02.1.1]RUU71833.1 Hsp20/alpha crystallin family protein [Mesorhizobium sp. M2C.T.Ca.TU.009.01.2.1]CDX53225.1 Heat shock protein Hsp20 [Mesorhizobium plurifarium]
MAEAATKLPVRTEKAAPASPRSDNWTTPFESLRREVDRLFDDFHPFDFRLPSSRSFFGRHLPAFHDAAWPVAPAMDLVEKANGFEITAELPGIDEKNVDIKLANNVLTIKGEKNEEKEEKEKDYYLSERRYGSFQRSFQLPDGVDADKIDASFAKGVLTVKLPKTAEARKAEKKITVKAA